MPLGAVTRRWAPQTRWTLWRNAASIMKGLIYNISQQIAIRTPKLTLSQLGSSRLPRRTNLDFRISTRIQQCPLTGAVVLQQFAAVLRNHRSLTAKVAAGSLK